MAHAGTAALLVVFLTLVDHAQAFDFAALRTAARGLDGSTRTTLFMLALAAALFFPVGLARGGSPTELGVALAAFAVKVLALATFLGVVESSYAKLRFFRLPQFLALGLLCAFLALALRIL